MVVQISLPVSARDVPGPSNAGMAWIADATGRLLGVDQSGRQRQRSLPAGLRAREISVGPDGTLWLLAAGAEARPMLARQVRGEFDAVPTSLPAVRIAAGTDGTLWTVTDHGEVWSLRPDGSERRHSPAGEHFAAEISTGLDGSVWIISTATRYGGRIIRRLAAASDTWFELPAPAAATKVAVAPDGMAWTVNAKGAVWRLHPQGGGNLAECQVDTACSECRFSAPADLVRDVSVGPDGTVWVLASSGPTGPVTLRWLADPLRRQYRVVPTPLRPVRVAAGTV
jgi:streptogramin lyase